MTGDGFEIVLTRRKDGAELSRPPLFQDAKVEIPLLDARTASVKLPMFDVYSLNDTGVGNIDPHRFGLKIRYRDQLVFHGVQTDPEWEWGEGWVTVNAQDPSIYMQHHHLGPLDTVLIDDTNPLNQHLRLLVAAVQLDWHESDVGYMPPGIRLGRDVTRIADYAGYERKSDIGVNVWDELLELSGKLEAPDWMLEPIDAEYDPQRNWEPGDMVRFNTYKRYRRELADTIQWHYGWGADNVEDFNERPAGSEMLNRFTALRDPDQDKKKVPAMAYTARYLPSLRARGIMEGRDTPTGRLSAGALKQFARAQILQFGLPPVYFDITPRVEAGKRGSAVGSPWRYGTDYREGDVVRVLARKGRRSINVDGRVMKVTLNQANQQGGIKPELEVIPHAEVPASKVTHESQKDWEVASA